MLQRQGGQLMQEIAHLLNLALHRRIREVALVALQQRALIGQLAHYLVRPAFLHRQPHDLPLPLPQTVDGGAELGALERARRDDWTEECERGLRLGAWDGAQKFANELPSL